MYETPKKILYQLEKQSAYFQIRRRNVFFFIFLCDSNVENKNFQLVGLPI